MFSYGSGMGQGRLTHIVTHTILTSFSTFSRGKIEKCDLFKEIKNETVAYSVLPNQARYQLRYTRIFTFLHDTTENGKNKDFSVCGHLCGQSRFYAVFNDWGKFRKRRCRKALRRFASHYPGYRHGTPNAGALPTAQHPDMKLWNCPGVSSQSKRATNCATPGFLRLPSTVCQGREPTAYQDRLLLYWTHSV